MGGNTALSRPKQVPDISVITVTDRSVYSADFYLIMDSLDIISPNPVFVNQSRTYSIQFSDFIKEDTDSLTR